MHPRGRATAAISELAAGAPFESKLVARWRRSKSTPFKRTVKLQLIDSNWHERSAALNDLRQGSHLRGYAQESHKQEYKRVAHALLSKLLGLSNAEFTRVVMTVRIQTQQVAVESASASATQNQPPHLRGAA